jgi:hypothetical protein
MRRRNRRSLGKPLIGLSTAAGAAGLPPRPLAAAMAGGLIGAGRRLSRRRPRLGDARPPPALRPAPRALAARPRRALDRHAADRIAGPSPSSRSNAKSPGRPPIGALRSERWQRRWIHARELASGAARVQNLDPNVALDPCTARVTALSLSPARYGSCPPPVHRRPARRLARHAGTSARRVAAIDKSGVAATPEARLPPPIHLAALRNRPSPASGEENSTGQTRVPSRRPFRDK